MFSALETTPATAPNVDPTEPCVEMSTPADTSAAAGAPPEPLSDALLDVEAVPPLDWLVSAPLPLVVVSGP